MCRVKRLRLRGGALGSAGVREADGLRCKDAKRQRSEANLKILGYYGTKALRSILRSFHLAPWGRGQNFLANECELRNLGEGSVGGQDDINIFLKRTYSPRKRAAFTLAEVLITLGIIGVVAAMTMPTLINKTQNKQLETAFKVAYSTFSQAVINMREEEGPGLRKSYATYDSSIGKYPRADEFYEKFYKYSKLNVIGECNYTGKFMNYNRTAEAYTSWSGVPSSGREGFPDALSNGMCASVHINAGEINVSFDVNGTKGPNQLGHDIFYFYIDNNDTLKPRKMSKLYSEEELEDMQYAFNRGTPCSMQSKQQGNGVGCAGYALIDRNPDDPSKGYWESLP